MPAAPKLEHVAVEQPSDGITIVRYNRPKAGNALNTPVLRDILAGLQYAENDTSTRIIITTGTGKFYTTGLDLLDPTNAGPNNVSTVSDDFSNTLSQIHELLIKTDKVTIAAVNGPAPGWGTSSLTLHDMVYSTEDAFFFTPFVQWGLCAEGCSSLTFAKIMGRQKASALILGGARMTAKEMAEAGLVTKVLGGGDGFMQEVLKIAGGISKLPPKSLMLNKRLMMETDGYREKLLETNARELRLLAEQTRGQESLGAVRSFKESQERRKKEKAAAAAKL